MVKTLVSRGQLRQGFQLLHAAPPSADQPPGPSGVGRRRAQEFDITLQGLGERLEFVGAD